MRPIEEIRRNKKLMFQKMPMPLILGGFVELKGGKRASFCFSTADGIEHASIQLYARRLPTWDEMCEVKDIFWDEEEDVVQVHPRRSVYVNLTEALHLLRPCDGDWNKMMDMVARGLT